MLLKYFSNDLDYPNTDDIKVFTQGQNDTVLKAGPLYYCEFYGHCQKTPCIDSRANIQKNHDLDLKLSKKKNTKYIIQYRHPLEAIISWYLAEILRKKRFEDSLNDSKQEWLHFIQDTTFKNKMKFWDKLIFRNIPGKILYWKLFIKKWIMNQDLFDTYCLSYRELTNNPEEKLKSIIRFINPDQSPNINFIKKIISKQNIHKGRNTAEKIKEFKYYDSLFFQKLEEKVYSELHKLNMKRNANI
ncbi:MAG: sulfotransferase domain-containing protein [Candidatus Omnitrophota bacterium]